MSMIQFTTGRDSCVVRIYILYSWRWCHKWLLSDGLTNWRTSYLQLKNKSRSYFYRSRHETTDVLRKSLILLKALHFSYFLTCPSSMIWARSSANIGRRYTMFLIVNHWSRYLTGRKRSGSVCFICVCQDSSLLTCKIYTLVYHVVTSRGKTKTQLSKILFMLR